MYKKSPIWQNRRGNLKYLLLIFSQTGHFQRKMTLKLLECINCSNQEIAGGFGSSTLAIHKNFIGSILQPKFRY